MSEKKLARFLNDDPGGLWKAGEIVEDLGPESHGPGLDLTLLRKLDTGELITLTRPYERNILEEI